MKLVEGFRKARRNQPEDTMQRNETSDRDRLLQLNEGYENGSHFRVDGLRGRRLGALVLWRAVVIVARD